MFIDFLVKSDSLNALEFLSLYCCYFRMKKLCEYWAIQKYGSSKPYPVITVNVVSELWQEFLIKELAISSYTPKRRRKLVCLAQFTRDLYWTRSL